ncbi:GLPGLI family protein [uncultured Chryseobacterium sp.]|uniref:GLPGLI family protein n=1 Tax=uncultured Chryseobacterium sp. TaxID=259322 RepID=UPI0025D282D0|nr:GLPGLI family protein [uncultured Chryseobacterium sp.]
MKIKLYFILILVFNLSFSQTKRYIYELSYKPDSTEAYYKKNFMVVDINPKEVKYYDYKFLEKDSLNILQKSQNLIWTTQIPVVRKRNSDTHINYPLIGDNIYAYPTQDPIKWKLENDTKNYLGFKVQKATTDFGGRKWIAWFTKEIPFSEGPYKFQRLPGLILQIKDTQENYIFNLIKSTNLPETYNTTNIIEVRYGDTPIPTNEKTVIKKALEYFNDPFNDIRQEFNRKAISSFEYNGVKYKPEELSKLVKEEQEDILKSYNPIERNKAFPYPKN